MNTPHEAYRTKIIYLYYFIAYSDCQVSLATFIKSPHISEAFERSLIRGGQKSESFYWH
jgi:hypothetical protein